MTQPQIEIQIIASLVAVACSLPGAYLVLRKMAMITDAITHAILPGIVVGFILTGSVNSFLLIVLAAASGLLTVVLVELILKTRLIAEDAAIGLVFSALFSIGVILISKNVGNVHLDTDTVLLGELAFAPFDRLMIAGWDAGPKSAWVMGIILILNLLFIGIFYKELKLSTFDAGLAASLGFAPAVLNYALMGLVSVTTVGAFDAVGAILVVALMIAPAATAYLITDKLKWMILISAVAGIVSAISGYWVARMLDASIAGSMAMMCGLIFLMAYLLAPGRGIIAVLHRRKRQKLEFAQMTLLMHVVNHMGTEKEQTESHISHLRDHFGWNKQFVDAVVKRSVKQGIIKLDGQLIIVTNKGERFTDAANALISAGHHPGFSRLKNEFMIFTD
ncbi:MAG: metal ABC transporter permease [Bacteroidales bacterium]